ncbi:MAG TPA: hypothetical protein VK978_02620 [Candidatus Saccharimonadales bacterium]|nr:hypothetical protein [Candidatus Saccharimonadales bacterium]
MAAELITPTDELSGLPLPLLPSDEVLPTNNGEVANWHHHFHPKTHPIITGTLGGRALRSARIQLVDTNQHNYSENAYHRFFAGPPIPESRDAQFGLCVLSCAGYVPEKAIEVADGEPHIRRMTDTQIDRLRMKPEVTPPEPWQVEKYRKQRMPQASYRETERVLARKWQLQADLSYRNLRYGYDPMKAFFTEVVLDQDLFHLPEPIIEEFVERGSTRPGMTLLAQAAVQAVETTVHNGHKVSELYRITREAGQLHDGMPPNAASMVKYKLGELTARMALLPMLRQRMGGPMPTGLVAA